MKKNPFLISSVLLAISYACAAAPSTPPLLHESFEVGAPSAHSTQPSQSIDITGTSLTQLMDLKITTLSGKSESLNTAPAAVYVITGDEIKRMGVTQLAEALRYVPGVEVARNGNNQWAIAIRGFNSSTSNTLLAVIDGRSIYSTLYGGVLWQQQDVLLEDVDRIEIVRGPGGTIWGANAVNGVINIITKSARDTQGTVFIGGLGTANNLQEVRVGSAINENTFSRVYTKVSHQNRASSTHINDAAQMFQSGFRVDHYGTLGDITLSGDIYRGGFGAPVTGLQATGIQSNLSGEPYDGYNILFNWSHHANPERSHKILAYIDHTFINAKGVLTDLRNTANINYQLVQHFNLQELTFGMGYRNVRDRDVSITTSPKVTGLIHFIPVAKLNNLYSTFFQDDISFLNNKAHFIFGTKYEHNDYTGSEWEPSVRTSYTANNSLLWAAWSRAVRVPTRLEEDWIVPGSLNGNTHLLSEVASSVFELGWRKSWPRGVQLDITGYTSKYIHLIATEPAIHNIGNRMVARVTGVEIAPSIQLKPNWLIRANYSHILAHAGVARSSSAKSSAILLEKNLPQHLLQLISMWDINENWQFNAYLRYVSQILASSTHVPGYVVADASVAWKPNKTLHWELVGRNLGKKHYEWGGSSAPDIVPSVALYLTVNL